MSYCETPPIVKGKESAIAHLNSLVLQGKTAKATREAYEQFKEKFEADTGEAAEPHGRDGYEDFAEREVYFTIEDAAYVLRDKFYCSAEDAFALLKHHLAPHFEIRIDDDGLKDSLKHGAYHHSQFKTKAYVSRGAANIEPRDWIYGGHYLRKNVSGTVSPGGVGKSAMVLAEAISMATGRDLFTGRPTRQMRVWYHNAEETKEELERRIEAICLHFGIEPWEYAGQLFVTWGQDTKITIATETRNGVEIMKPVCRELVRDLRINRIDAFICDPFIRSHSINENDNTKVDAVIQEFLRIARDGDCAVELVHHTRKTGGEEITEEDARGGSAFKDGVRSLRTLNVMTEAEAKKAMLANPALARRSYFRVTKGKVNYQPPAHHADWRYITSVLLGNERPDLHLAQDSVGVVVPWTWPEPTDDLPLDALQKAKEAIAEGSWRLDSQAKDWAGKAIAVALGLDLANEGHKAKVKELIKTWTTQGHFMVVEDLDEKRKKREFVRVTPK